MAFYHHPIKLVVFDSCRPFATLWRLWQVMLVVEVSCVARPGQLTIDLNSQSIAQARRQKKTLDNQQDLPKMSQNWQKAYRNQYN